MNNQNTIMLIKVADIIPGFAFKGEDFGSEGETVIKIKDINPPSIVTSNADKVNLKNYNKDGLSKYLLNKGDFVVAMTGATIGKVGKLTNDDSCYVNQRVAKIIPKKGISKEFVYYTIQRKSFVEFVLNRLDSSSAQGNISADGIGEFLVPNYKEETQQKIALVLSSLDSKIELNNRINTELEAMVKTLYDSWFVQFDFPDKNGKPYKTSGGKMVWNEELKREVPEGSVVCTVDECAEVKKGELITAKDAEEGTVKVVAAGVDYSYLHSTPNRLNNTITISGSGANAGYINFWREPIFASDCITVRGKSDAETLILLQYLKFIQPHILSQATGSAQPHVYPSDIKVLNYVVPPTFLIKNYGEISIPMNEKIGKNLIENQKLTELRDWLLPMLMNGQVKDETD